MPREFFQAGYAGSIPDCHPRFDELNDGAPCGVRDFQVFVDDNSFLTVRNGVITSTNDVRGTSLLCTNRIGLELSDDEWTGCQLRLIR